MEQENLAPPCQISKGQSSDTDQQIEPSGISILVRANHKISCVAFQERNLCSIIFAGIFRDQFDDRSRQSGVVLLKIIVSSRCILKLAFVNNNNNKALKIELPSTTSTGLCGQFRQKGSAAGKQILY
jgi:hypothetical protein